MQAVSIFTTGTDADLSSHFYCATLCSRGICCPSVRPSVCYSRFASKRLDGDGIELVFGMAASFDLSYILYCKEIRVPPKLRILPSPTLPQTLDLENFATASRWCGQQKSSMVQLADYTHDGRARRGRMQDAQSLLHVGRL